VPELSWWLLSNRHGGIHVTRAADAVDARRQIREAIAQAGIEHGMSRSAAKRYASTYSVWVIAGGCTRDEVWEARDAWDADDLNPAEALRRKYGPCRHPLTATGS
jgi:hypothetical protein